jgi:3-hydroxyisobutyrate dehydrogenase-like beta-hydroxyacid dehydrogenase
MSGKYLEMPAVLAVIALLLLALPSRADVRVAIPAACRELADRAGLPLTLTPAEAARAVAYIRVMVSQDPAVARCRLALRSY